MAFRTRRDAPENAITGHESTAKTVISAPNSNPAAACMNSWYSGFSDRFAQFTPVSASWVRISSDNGSRPSPAARTEYRKTNSAAPNR